MTRRGHIKCPWRGRLCPFVQVYRHSNQVHILIGRLRVAVSIASRSRHERRIRKLAQ